ATTAAVLRYAEECDRELRVRLGHRLKPAWRRFKRHHIKAPTLNQFDAVVAGLDRWRGLRYPELPIAGDGISMTTSPEKGPHPTSTRVDKHGRQIPMTTYHLCLEDMDELFAAIAPLEFSQSALITSIEGRSGPADPGMATYVLNNKQRHYSCYP